MRFKARLIVVAALTLIAYTALANAEGQNNWQGVERIVAIGDLHGGYEKFVDILREAGLINKRKRWTGGKTHLVQTGDIVDRGPDSRKIIDLLRKLEKQAQKKGGYVHVLIGNHEAMMVQGDLRYVHEGEYKAFRTRRSKKFQQRYFEQYVAAVKARLTEEEWPEFNKAYRESWNARFPLGYVEHQVNWHQTGEYGLWAASNNTVIIINDTLFVHGGISPKYGALEVEEFNTGVSGELLSAEFVENGMATDPEGPLWYRGLALMSEDDPELQAHLEAFMGRLGIRRIVIGHTFTPGAVIPRFGGKVVQIDVGLGPAYGDNYAFLVIENGILMANHRGHPVPLPGGCDSAKIEYLKYLSALDSRPSPLLDLIAAL